MTPKRLIACTLLVCCTCWAAAYGQEVRVKGMITGRTGDEMTIRTADGDRTVVLTDNTKAKVPAGVFRHKETSMAELIPGLSVEVTGTDVEGKLVAKTVSYTKEDLKIANAIHAGMAPTQEHVAANREAIGTNKENIAANKEQIGVTQERVDANQAAVEQRFADLTDFDVRGSVTVYFPVGKATLSKDSKAALLQLASKATGLQGYLIEVKGYCDSTGSAAQNQTLSRARAESVVNFLHQQGQISIRRVMAPGAMGVVEPAASNETAKGRAENRRVEVKLLVNRGLAPSAE